jgi:fatty acid elongase 3
MAALNRIPIPTLDRPFGIHLWPYFDKVYTKVTGYSATDFKFKPGITPLSTVKETVLYIGLYYVIILGGREFMRNRKPMQLKGLFLVHNLYLTAISAILLALFLEQLIPTVARNGIFFAICNKDGGWTKPLVTLYYVRQTLKVLSARDSDPVTAQLPDQVPRAAGHCFPVPQEEAS